MQTSSPANSDKAKPTDSASREGLIEWGDFDKVNLRLGEVKEAERVPKSDKLLRLQVDIGEGEPRQILAGIGKHYAPEDLLGRRLVVVANLKPRKMMGLESRGMVLAVSDDAALSVLSPDKLVTPGVRAS